MTLDGRDISRLSASRRTRAGLGRAFQLTNLFPRLSVLENVRLAVQAARGRQSPARPEPVEHLERPQGPGRRAPTRSCARWRWPTRQHELVASLPHGDQRKLEVALLMALESKVFMFDEPTAGMNAAEAPVILT